MSYALGLGADRPAPAGILALSGFIPTVERWQPSFLGRERASVFITHGRNDPIIDMSFARAADELLRDSPLSVKYHESDAAHHVEPESVQLATEWIEDVLDG
jgi:phospholipase/carboxylesterase